MGSRKETIGLDKNEAKMKQGRIHDNPCHGRFGSGSNDSGKACSNTNFSTLKMPKNEKKKQSVTDRQTQSVTDRHGDLWVA